MARALGTEILYNDKPQVIWVYQHKHGDAYTKLILYYTTLPTIVGIETSSRKGGEPGWQ